LTWWGLYFEVNGAKIAKVGCTEWARLVGDRRAIRFLPQRTTKGTRSITEISAEHALQKRLVCRDFRLSTFRLQAKDRGAAAGDALSLSNCARKVSKEQGKETALGKLPFSGLGRLLGVYLVLREAGGNFGGVYMVSRVVVFALAGGTR
jgi:hypothetical protein